MKTINTYAPSTAATLRNTTKIRTVVLKTYKKKIIGYTLEDVLVQDMLSNPVYENCYVNSYTLKEAFNMTLRMYKADSNKAKKMYRKLAAVILEYNQTVINDLTLDIKLNKSELSEKYQLRDILGTASTELQELMDLLEVPYNYFDNWSPAKYDLALVHARDYGVTPRVNELISKQVGNIPDVGSGNRFTDKDIDKDVPRVSVACKQRQTITTTLDKQVAILTAMYLARTFGDTFMETTTVHNEDKEHNISEYVTMTVREARLGCHDSAAELRDFQIIAKDVITK